MKKVCREEEDGIYNYLILSDRVIHSAKCEIRRCLCDDCKKTPFAIQLSVKEPGYQEFTYVFSYEYGKLNDTIQQIYDNIKQLIEQKAYNQYMIFKQTGHHAS